MESSQKVEWYNLPKENAEQKLMLEISNGGDYDIILRVKTAGYSQLAEQGALQPLEEYLDKYGKNILAAASERAWDNVKDKDGHILGIPYITGSADEKEPYGIFSGGIAIREDVLKELNLKIPETRDEFTEFLRAAKQKYGVAPLTADKSTPYIDQIMKSFSLSGNEWYDVNGVYTPRIKTEQFAKYVEYMQMLYKEGLLDNDFPINTSDTANEKLVGKTAVAKCATYFWDVIQLLPAIKESGSDSKLEFLSSLKSDQYGKYENYFSAFGPNTSFSAVSCISQNAKHPEDAVQFMNLLTDTDNYKRLYIGKEGVSYEVKNGNYYSIFNEADKEHDFSSYTNADKYGIIQPAGSFKMWQARARKTPEMAESFEKMNKITEDPKNFVFLKSLESGKKNSNEVLKYTASLNTQIQDGVMKAIVEGTDVTQLINDLKKTWDENGGLEAEKIMQQYYDENKDLLK